MGMELLIADAEAFDEENESAVMEFAAMKEAEAMAELVEKANVVLEGTTLSLTLVAKPCYSMTLFSTKKLTKTCSTS